MGMGGTPIFKINLNTFRPGISAENVRPGTGLDSRLIPVAEVQDETVDQAVISSKPTRYPSDAALARLMIEESLC